MDKKEKQRMKKYFIKQAKKAEGAGFISEAARIYDQMESPKSKRLYLSVAKTLEKKGILFFAAEAYECAGKIDKARALWKQIAKKMEKEGLSTIAKEALKKSKPEDAKFKKTRKIVFPTADLVRKGKFREAQKAWIKAAKYRESLGEYDTASMFYFNGGDIKNAERAWEMHKKGK